MNRFIEMLVSIKRINAFLNSSNKDFDFLGLNEQSQDCLVEIENGNFIWKDTSLKEKPENEKTNPSPAIELSGLSLLKQTNSNFKLQDLNFKIKKGETVFIIGKSNSGKSSLLYTILGETLCTNNPSHGQKVIRRTD